MHTFAPRKHVIWGVVFTETKSHSHWQFPRIWKILWRSFLESFYVNTAQIGNEWDCWASSAQSERSYVYSIVAVKEATSTVFLQPGLDEKWWADSMESCCYLRNLQDLLSVGKIPYERRFAVPCDGPVVLNGPVVPFGAMVEYAFSSARDLSRLHQFGPQVLPWKFFGYTLHAGRIWKGDILVADIEELEQMEASEIHAKRLSAKEVLTPLSGGNFIFPIADGTVKLSGGDQVLRTYLNPGSPRPRGKIKEFFKENQMNYILWYYFKETQRLMMRSWFLVRIRQFYFPSSRGTQSQSARAARRIIS